MTVTISFEENIVATANAKFHENAFNESAPETCVNCGHN
jgi:hypothetical protein